MNAKFSFRAIQQGQTQQSHVVNSGAGQNGQALVVRAAAGTRYQLADLVTLTSPKKLQLKRDGQDLLVALPGNDVGSPDIIIKDYFNFKDLSLSGLAPSGEPMVYDTSSSFNIGQSATGITPESLAANKTTAATLATASSGWFDSGWGLAAVGGGVALIAAAAGGGSSSSTTSGLFTKISSYRQNTVTNASSEPSEADFSNAGVTGVSIGNLVGINSFLTSTTLPLSSTASVQALVDSYNRITQKANGNAADDTTNDPTSADYRNLLGLNTPFALNDARSDFKSNAVTLLNDRIKSLTFSAVDRASLLRDYANYVQVVAQLAQSAPSTTGTADTTGNITAPQLTSLGVDVTAISLAAVSDAIRASADDLSALNTTAKLTALVRAYNTILAEANGAAIDATPAANPTAADYAAIGADIGSAKTDTAALARLNAIVGSLASTSVDTVGEIAKLAATLDKIQTVAALATGATLTDAQKFSAEELRNLGLSAFTVSATVTQKMVDDLALAVSAAIRDKAPADVIAGDFANGRLVNDSRTTWSQSQIERLQTLVSLEIIKNYLVDTVNSANTTLAPNANDWTNVGVFSARTDGSGKFDAINATQLAYLNTAVAVLPAASVDTNANLQTIVDAYARIMQEANGTTADANTSLNPIAGDLATIGTNGVASGSQAETLMLDIIANRSNTDVDTLPKLQAMADTAAKILKAAEGTAVSFTPTELAAIGLRGASATGASSNLTDFVSHVQATNNDGSGTNSLAKLQSFMSLAVVQAWARDVNPNANVNPAVAKTAATPSEQDYKDIGVVRVVPKNANGTAGTDPGLISLADRNALNDAIDSLVDNSTATAADDAMVNTLAKVQSIATSYFKILNEANGSASDFTTGNTIQNTDGVSTANDAIDLNPNPSGSDYQNIGVTGAFNNNRTSLLNTLIAEKNFAQVDTVKEIQTLATAVDKVLALAGGSGDLTLTGYLTLTEFSTDLGLSGVNEANRSNVNSAIQAQTADNNIDSFAELQSLVSFTRIQRYADTNGTSTGTGGANEGGALPTSATGNYTDDWRNLIGLDGETSGNYVAYNSAVDALAPAEITGVSRLQTLVTSYNKILAEANGTATDQTTADPLLADYSNIGLDLSALWTNVDSGNRTQALNLFNASIKTLTTDKVDSLDELRALATAVGKVVDLAEVTVSATENTTNNNGQVTRLTNTMGLTMADLKLMGLQNTDKAVDSSGSYFNNEAPNIYAAIQNATPDNTFTHEWLQTAINSWVI